MKMVPLTQGMFALVDDEDYEAVAQYKWFTRRDQTCHSCYAVRQTRREGGGQRPQAMHQFLMGIKGVDHKDGNGLNNQRANLREATPAQQCANTAKRRGGTSSRFKGVCWNKRLQKWSAQIRWDRHLNHLGVFVDEEDAARAYDRAARELFGEFARLNFPLD